MLPRFAFRSSRGVAARLARPVMAARALPRMNFSSLAVQGSRAYSAAAPKLKDTEDEFFVMSSESVRREREPDTFAQKTQAKEPEVVEFMDEAFFAPELTKSEEKVPGPSAVEPTAKVSGPITKLVPFSALKGRMDHDTLKALTFKPFDLLAMSEVQKRVLGRMPELSGVKTKASIVAAETEEDTLARQKREEAGREDLLVKARTGTGKTIAFLVPAIDARLNRIEELVSEPLEDGTIPSGSAAGQRERLITRSHVGALIISPTRELATQIANEALKLCTWHKDFQVQLFVGGASRHLQLKNFNSIRKGRKDIIVATPGRLRDLLTEPSVADAIATTDTFILDEADTLLEMGFRNDLNDIVSHMPKERQTFMFSATVSKDVQQIAKSFLKPNHSFIDCVPKNESNVHLHVPQFASVVKHEEQLPHLVRLVAHDQLINPQKSKVIVFLPTTKQTMLFATLFRELSSSLPSGLRVHEIHSRLSQDQRSRAADRFRRDQGASVLVTSDVSARGVDYPNVTRVVQVGIPSSTEQYIHRVGRTGRGGKEGGRGDLILLPFEGEFLNQLSKVPITKLKADEFASSVEALADQDQADKLAGVAPAVEQLMPMLDPEAINDVFTSLLGYYLNKTDQLNRSPGEILDGLKDWTVRAAGLPQPPFLSAGFLAKLGLTERKLSRGRPTDRQRPPPAGARKSFGFNRDREGGDRPRRSSFSSFEDRPRQSFDSDRPRRSFEDGDRPRRTFEDGDRPKRSFEDGDRPRRSFNSDRPRTFDRNSDRPRRSFDSSLSSRGSSGPRSSWSSRRND